MNRDRSMRNVNRKMQSGIFQRLALGLALIASLFFGANRLEAACTFVLGATAQNYSYTAITGQVTVTTQSTCTWSSVSTTNWITVTSATNHTNSGTVTYTVATNSFTVPRTGQVAIAGQLLTVT